MRRRDRDRLAQAELIGFEPAGLGGLPLAFVGEQDHRALRFAQVPGEDHVVGGDAGARIDQEQHHIGGGHGTFGLRPHAPFERVGRRVFEPCGIDQGEMHPRDRTLALAAVASDAGPIVHDRVATAGEAVEQGGLAYIGASDDGDGEWHARPALWPFADQR